MNSGGVDSANVVTRCVDLYNHCTTEWVDTYYSSNVDWNELPTATLPDGRKGDRNALRHAAEITLSFFPDRQMKIKNLVARERSVALELEWWGTASRSMGNVKAGEIVRLLIASFFEVTENLITRHTDYCVTVAKSQESAEPASTSKAPNG
jgi:predicted ester cyclase